MTETHPCEICGSEVRVVSAPDGEGTNHYRPVLTVDRLREALREHWLVTVGCDHEAGTDTPVCACSRVPLGTHQSVQEAVNAWAEHVIEEAGRG